MKRLTALLLTLILILLLTACGGESTPKADDGAKPSSSQVVFESKSDNKTETGKEAKKETKNEISFTEVLAVDNDDCLIKITEIAPSNLWGFTLKALFENKSTDKTYMFSVESAAINGVKCDPFFATEVTAGKKANKEISFQNSILEENGVGDFTDIELTFRVYDSNDWSSDAVAHDTIHIYPYGEDKAVKFVRDPKDSDTVLIDNDHVTVIATSFEKDGIWGYTINLFLLNKTDKNVMFSVDDASINGFMADPFYATSVAAGKCAFSSMSWSNQTLEENGITDVEEIEFKLRAYDEDNWMGNDFANEPITLNP